MSDLVHEYGKNQLSFDIPVKQLGKQKIETLTVKQIINSCPIEVQQEYNNYDHDVEGYAVLEKHQIKNTGLPLGTYKEKSFVLDDDLKKGHIWAKQELWEDDFTIAGAGSRGIVAIDDDGNEIECMAIGIKSICGCGGSGGTYNAKCRKIYCPKCWGKWLQQVTFRTVVQIEAYARYTGERPAHVTASVKPYPRSWNNLKEDLIKKGTRRIKRVMCGTAGMWVYHHHRIKKQAFSDMIRDGYLEIADDGKFKDDKRKWSLLRKYCAEKGKNIIDYLNLGQHTHHIVFPGYLEGHKSGSANIVIKRIDNSLMRDLSQVINVVRYQLSHCAVSEFKERNKPYNFWGKLFNFSPEKHMKNHELHCLKIEVAEAMGLYYYDDDLQFISRKERDEAEAIRCHKCGTKYGDFYTALDFKKMTDDVYQSWVLTAYHTLGDKLGDLLRDISHMLREDTDNFVPLKPFISDLEDHGIYLIHIGSDPPQLDYDYVDFVKLNEAKVEELL